MISASQVTSSWRSILAIGLATLVFLLGLMGALRSFDTAADVARQTPDPSFEATAEAIALTAGLGPSVAREARVIAGERATGSTFALLIDRGVSAGQAEALRQALRFVLFPRILVDSPVESELVLRAGVTPGGLRLTRAGSPE